MAAMLSVDSILKANDVIEKEVEVKAWGGKVKVRTLSLAGRYAINEYAITENGNGKKIDTLRFAAATLAHGLAEPKITFDDAMKLLEKNAEVVESVIAAIWEASGLRDGELKNVSPKG